MRFHDLRHTSVALAIAGGAHPKAIQTRMGHSSITVTLDGYGHLFPELDEAIARSFGDGLVAARSRHEHRVVNADFGSCAGRPGGSSLEGGSRECSFAGGSVASSPVEQPPKIRHLPVPVPRRRGAREGTISSVLLTKPTTSELLLRPSLADGWTHRRLRRRGAAPDHHPGVDMTLVTRQRVAHRRQAALRTTLGVNTGALCWGVRSAVGVATPLERSGTAFQPRRWDGAAHLV